ncbi:MAG: hypothetical protein VB087_07950 [Candidatus Limiplasma sp.]|nr:hypothetical protein [Candidatus Limiplasma sp.]MEA5144918.1 hypothetical protein [Candidatus Limiplasma sp.]
MSEIKVTRPLLQQYYGTGSTPTYAYINRGFLKLSEENSPQIDKTVFVGDINTSPTVTGYENKWGYEAQYISGNEIIDDLVQIAREQLTGDDCERWLVDVDLSQPVSGTPGSYYARRAKIAVEATPPAGDPKTITKLSGNFHQIGDLTIGTFAVETKTFTADA